MRLLSPRVVQTSVLNAARAAPVACGSHLAQRLPNERGVELAAVRPVEQRWEGRRRLVKHARGNGVCSANPSSA